MKLPALTIRERIVAFVLYAIGLFCMQFLFTGAWLHSDIWDKNTLVINGLAFFALHLIDSPFFRTPKSSFVNGLGALVATLAVTSGSGSIEAHFIRWFGICFISMILVASAITFWFNKNESPRNKRDRVLDSLGYTLSAAIGRGEVLFSFPFVASAYANYGSSGSILQHLLLIWFVTIAGKPIEYLWRTVKGFLLSAGLKPNYPSLGKVIRIDHPNLIRLELLDKSKWNSSNELITKLPDNSIVRVWPLSTHMQGERLIATGIQFGKTLTKDPSLHEIPIGSVVVANDLPDLPVDEFLPTSNSSLIGAVCEGSSIGSLKFETTPNSLLQEGMIVFVDMEDSRVYYQIVEAQTHEEGFTGNPRGKVIASASQLGKLKTDRFEKFEWLPLMNTPVFSSSDLADDSNYRRLDNLRIGMLPGSNLEIGMDVEDALNYHCAILGVTGTGKTEVSLDIIGEAISSGYKVFCVDITGEYIQRLSGMNPQKLGLDEQRAKELDDRLFAVDSGEYGGQKAKQPLRDFVTAVSGDVRTRVDDFLRREGAALGVFDLPSITNTKATLRATELYLSAIMDWAKKNRQARKILIVLEEAHTVIPETAGAGFDFDTKWVVDRISQIALQGRKYGVGLLIVSQRTALVSKSVLSQCNTYITFRLVDRTSLDYLGNVYSSEHIKAIPGLKKLQAVAYGHAFRSDRPLMLEIPFDPNKESASDALNKTIVKREHKRPDAIPDESDSEDAMAMLDELIDDSPNNTQG